VLVLTSYCSSSRFHDRQKSASLDLELKTWIAKLLDIKERQKAAKARVRSEQEETTKMQANGHGEDSCKEMSAKKMRTGSKEDEENNNSGRHLPDKHTNEHHECNLNSRQPGSSSRVTAVSAGTGARGSVR